MWLHLTCMGESRALWLTWVCLTFVFMCVCGVWGFYIAYYRWQIGFQCSKDLRREISSNLNSNQALNLCLVSHSIYSIIFITFLPHSLINKLAKWLILNCLEWIFPLYNAHLLCQSIFQLPKEPFWQNSRHLKLFALCAKVFGPNCAAGGHHNLGKKLQ